MKKFFLFLIPLSCFAEFSSSDSASLAAIDEDVQSILSYWMSMDNSFTAMRNNQIAPIKTDVHDIKSYVETIMNNLPSSGTTNQFIDYTSYLSSVNPLAAIKYLNSGYSYTDLNPSYSSEFNQHYGDNNSHNFSYLLSEIIRRLGYLQNTSVNLGAQGNLILADTRNAITNNLTHQVTSGLGYQYQIIGQDSDISSLPSRQSRSILPVGPYSTSYLLFKLLQEQGYIGSTQSYYLRDFVLQLQDIRRLLAQHSLGSTNIVNVGITNIVDIAQLDPLWRGIGEEFDIGRLWSEAFITPNKDGDVIQETYLTHYDDLSTHFFEAVPELILMGVRQRKSVNTTLFNVLTNIQIHTTFLRSIDNNLAIIASNFNYDVQNPDASSEVSEVKNLASEAASALKIDFHDKTLRQDLNLDNYFEEFQAHLPEFIELDFSSSISLVNWTFFDFRGISPNEFVFTADIRPYSTFFGYIRGLFLFGYICICLLIMFFIFKFSVSLFSYFIQVLSSHGF